MTDPKAPEDSSLALPSGYAVDVHTSPERLELRAPDGRVCLVVRIGPDGPRVELEAASLAIATRGDIALRSENLVLDARRDVVVRAGGDLRMEAEGALASRAFEQHIEATSGDIHVEANDDVRVDGERIRLNSPDAPPLRRLGRGAGVDLPRMAPVPAEPKGQDRE